MNELITATFTTEITHDPLPLLEIAELARLGMFGQVSKLTITNSGSDPLYLYSLWENYAARDTRYLDIGLPTPVDRIKIAASGALTLYSVDLDRIYLQGGSASITADSTVANAAARKIEDPGVAAGEIVGQTDDSSRWRYLGGDGQLDANWEELQVGTNLVYILAEV